MSIKFIDHIRLCCDSGGTCLSEGVAARNWFTTIDVSSAIAFPVKKQEENKLIIYNSVQSGI